MSQQIQQSLAFLEESSLTNGIKVKSKHDHQDLPDPIADKCDVLENQIKQLQERLEQLEKSTNKEGDLH